jgi:hypothetical protein
LGLLEGELVSFLCQHNDTLRDTLLQKLESSNFLLGRIISYATGGFSSEDKLKDVEEFFSTRKVNSFVNPPDLFRLQELKEPLHNP